MGLVSRALGRVSDFMREMGRGLAVMRGEEPVAGYEPGVVRPRRCVAGFETVQRCRRKRPVG